MIAPVNIATSGVMVEVTVPVVRPTVTVPLPLSAEVTLPGIPGPPGPQGEPGPPGADGEGGGGGVLSHVYLIAPNVSTMGHSFWYVGTTTTPLNTHSVLAETVQVQQASVLTEFSVYVPGGAVAGSTLSFALFLVDPVTGLPTTKVTNIFTDVDCGTSGLKKVSGLSIPLAEKTLYGFVFTGGVTQPLVYGANTRSPAQSRGPLGFSVNAGDNLPRFFVWRATNTTPGVIDNAPAAWVGIATANLPNFLFKLAAA